MVVPITVGDISIDNRTRRPEPATMEEEEDDNGNELMSLSKEQRHPTREQQPPHPPSPQATASMCFYCFDVLFYELYAQYTTSLIKNNKQQQLEESFLSMTSNYVAKFPKSFLSVSQSLSSSSSSSSHNNNSNTSSSAATTKTAAAGLLSVVPPSGRQSPPSPPLQLAKPILNPTIDRIYRRNNNSNNSTTTIPDDDDELDDPNFFRNMNCPLFVTWEKRKHISKSKKNHPTTEVSSRTRTATPKEDGSINHDDIVVIDIDNAVVAEYELRGCIGSLTPKQLPEHLYHYIVSSAFHDTRFTPIRYSSSNSNNNHHTSGRSTSTSTLKKETKEMEEICSLRVSVSLLVNYEVCTHCYDWTVGTHGIIIKFIVPSPLPSNTAAKGGKHYTATFLPEVAVQQQWDQTTTIQQLIYKSGYTGTSTTTTKFLDSVHTTRYQSSKQHMTFHEYIKLYNTIHSKTDDDDDDSNIRNPLLQDLLSKIRQHNNHRNSTNGCEIPSPHQEPIGASSNTKSTNMNNGGGANPTLYTDNKISHRTLHTQEENDNNDSDQNNTNTNCRVM